MSRRHQDTSPNPLPPEATGAAPSGQSVLYKVASAAFSGGLIVLIALWIIPQLAGYADVGAALEAMRPSQILLLIIVGFIIMTLNGVAMAIPLRGITARRAFIAQQASTAVSNVIPGPSGTAARFAILHSWKVSVEDFTRGTFAVSIWSNVTMISMPGIAFLVLAIAQGTDFQGQNLLVLAVVALVVSVIAIGTAVAVLRSIPFARWLGRVTERIYNFCRRIFRKPPVSGLEEQGVELRARTIEVLRDRGELLTGVVVGNYWLNGVLLVFCIWLCGIPHSNLPFIVGLALYSIGRLSTVIQVTPGGVGVVEIAYTAVFTAFLGDADQPAVLAGVLVYRLLTYLMPIVVGGVCYLLWRWMRARERHAEEAAAVAA